MVKKVRFVDIFNGRVNEISNSIDKTSSKGDVRGMFFILPFVFIFSLFEFLWTLIIKKS